MHDSDSPRFYPLPVHEEPEAVRLRTWVQLARTFYRIEQSISARLAEKELTMAQFDVLATLRYSEGVTQKELAELLLVTKGNVVGLLDRLQKLDLVERRADPDDGRANRIHLTARGRRKLESVLPVHDRLVLRTLDCLDQQEVGTLRRLLKSLEQAL
ncbi:MAG: MarR family transcriptional regulator [Candidatus Eremiobacteraeota bacterium]|nr:MarR family transcriptional regulator [Candidatus Eremiobacteraeota bacterium]MCW5866494.1 MarR family transcriptional regulator [Candidatus Eremiobacteraeota bacterium]